MSSDNRVGVVIPAYNAEATLAATINSVLAQTHRALEIIVVDDGSTDSTGRIASEAAASDPRVRVLTVPNGGVARARNAGAAATHAAFLAPVDADDLWHPEKIARQLAVMRAGGADMGFVYTLHRRIDEQGKILTSSNPLCIAGHVYLRLLLQNFVGNGSALLVRRAAFDAVGGYNAALRDAGAQGTEDFLFQAMVARDWTVGVVPEFLTGYRRRIGAMSEDVERMEFSRRLALGRLRTCYPDTPYNLLAISEASGWARLAAYRMIVELSPLSSARALTTALRLAPVEALRVARHEIRRIIRSRIGSARDRWFPNGRMDFFSVDPNCGPSQAQSHPLGARIAALEADEVAFARQSAKLQRRDGHLRKVTEP